MAETRDNGYVYDKLLKIEEEGVIHHTYLPYTFPAVAGTHLLTPKGWRVE